MRSDWQAPPTVEGVIVRAWIGEDGAPDILHVQGEDVADNIVNLDQVIGDPDNPAPNRPFVMTGKSGVIARHGFKSADKLIGKRCLLYSDRRTNSVAIEPEAGDHWGLVVWHEFV